MQDTAKYKDQQAKTQKEKASDAAVKPVSDVIGDFELGAAKLAEEFPRLATAAEGAAIALGMLAAGGFAKGGYDLLTGGKGGLLKKLLRKGAGEAGEVGQVAEDVAEAAGGKSGWLGRGAKVVGRYAGKLPGSLKWLGDKLGPVGDAVMAGEVFYSEYLERGKDKVKANGGKVPSYMPQPVGGLDVLDELRGWVKSLESPSSKSDKAKTSANPPVIVYVTLDGHELTSIVETRIGQNARRHGA